MKLNVLCSIGHNIADSLADGSSLPLGIYGLDVWSDVRLSADRFIEVDLLTGTSTGGTPSPSLTNAFNLASQIFPEFCARHGVDSSRFHTLTVRFIERGDDKRFIVTVEDQHGRRAVDEYEIWPGRRVKILDDRGRIRKSPTAKAHTGPTETDS